MRVLIRAGESYNNPEGDLKKKVAESDENAAQMSDDEEFSKSKPQDKMIATEGENEESICSDSD